MSNEKDRHRVAMILLCVVSIVGCGALVLVALGVDVVVVKEILGIVFPPLVALAGNAVGYYFGQK